MKIQGLVPTSSPGRRRLLASRSRSSLLLTRRCRARPRRRRVLASRRGVQCCTLASVQGNLPPSEPAAALRRGLVVVVLAASLVLAAARVRACRLPARALLFVLASVLHAASSNSIERRPGPRARGADLPLAFAWRLQGLRLNAAGLVRDPRSQHPWESLEPVVTPPDQQSWLL